MPRVDKTSQSEQDEFDIALYIARDNPAAAKRLLQRFDRKLERLAEFPGLGRSRDDLMPGLRSYPIKKYLLLYRAVDDGIELLRVLHGMRDLKKHFP
jgi:toxin ParE1/3/4